MQEFCKPTKYRYSFFKLCLAYQNTETKSFYPRPGNCQVSKKEEEDFSKTPDLKVRQISRQVISLSRFWYTAVSSK